MWSNVHILQQRTGSKGSQAKPKSRALMSIVFGIVLIANNLIWAYLFWRRDNVMLELGKLLASRTLSEYSLSKKTENGLPSEPKDGYESIWEKEE